MLSFRTAQSSSALQPNVHLKFRHDIARESSLEDPAGEVDALHDRGTFVTTVPGPLAFARDLDPQWFTSLLHAWHQKARRTC